MTSEVHIQQTPQNLFDCPICLEILVIPITLTCGHTYACNNLVFVKPAQNRIFLTALSVSVLYVGVFNKHTLRSSTEASILPNKSNIRLRQNYKKRLEIAKTFTKDINEVRSTVIYRWIRNILPWMVIIILSYHLLKMKIHSLSFNFKGYKEKALKILNSIKVENSLQFKFFLFSQFLRFLFSTIAVF